MATLLIAKEVLEQMLFGYCENFVNITEIRDGGQIVEIDIAGQDVPDCDRVLGITHVQQNRAGQRFQRLTFEKAT